MNHRNVRLLLSPLVAIAATLLIHHHQATAAVLKNETLEIERVSTTADGVELQTETEAEAAGTTLLPRTLSVVSESGGLMISTPDGMERYAQ